MARHSLVDAYEVQSAKQLRDQATTVAEFRKALSVILIAEYGLKADQAAAALGTSRRTIFRDRSNLAVKTTLPKRLGVVAEIVHCPSKRKENSSLSGKKELQQEEC